MKYLKLFEEYSGYCMVLYHATREENPNLDIEKDSGLNIFGKGIYFSDSVNNIGEFGYSLPYEVCINKALNLNETITLEKADGMFNLYKNTFNKDIDYSFIKEYWNEGIWDDEEEEVSNDPIYIANFFEKLIEIDDSAYDLISGFVKKLGYDSMKHYANYRTDFIEEQPTGKYDEKFNTFIVFDNDKIRNVD